MNSRANIRLLICSPGIPHESEGASTVLFYQYIAGLKAAGFQILNILLLENGKYTEEALAAYKNSMEDAGTFEVFACRVDQFVRVGPFSIQLNIEAATEIQIKAKEFKPYVVFCIDLLSAWLLSDFQASKVVWLGDLNFQTYLYNAWYGTLENPRNLYGIPFVVLQAKIWKKIYRNVLRKIESVIVSSNSAKEQLRRIGVTSRYEPYPWPNQAGSTGPKTRSSIPTFLFFGTLSALGSRSAFRFIISSLYPRLLELWGAKGFQILICGSRGLPQWVQRALSDKPELMYLGFVADIDDVMARCHAVLVPIDIPVGNRSRIVTALAKGSLVIAHKNVALGNPDLTDGKNCFLAVNPAEFVDRMRRAFECPHDVEEIVANGINTYTMHFHPAVATGKIVQEIRRLARAVDSAPVRVCHAQS